MNIVYIVIGIGLLTAGGELLIRSALSTARWAGISPLLSGLVIVGFGTSSPELAVSIDAALSGLPDFAVGNVIGSNISNALLILGVCAMITPIAVHRSALRRDGLVALAAALLLPIMAIGSTLGVLDGLILVTALFGYIFWAYREERVKGGPDADLHEQQAELVEAVPGTLFGSIAGIIGGLVLLIGGSQVLLKGALGIAQSAGVSEAVIGLTLVAVGTSLPELTISVIAAYKGQADIAIGNVLGSNIINVMGILGISAIIQPLSIHPRMMQFDIWVMIAVTVILLGFLFSGRKLSRMEGVVLFLLYLGYVLCSFIFFETAA